MIHAEHFAAAVNNRTEKQDSNCLAIVIVMNVFLYNSVDQFHATNEIHHGETFQFECLEQKQNMLFNPTSWYAFLKLYNGFGVGFMCHKSTQLTQLLKEPETIWVRKKGEKHKQWGFKLAAETTVSLELLPGLNMLFHLKDRLQNKKYISKYYLQYACIWLCTLKKKDFSSITITNLDWK